MINQQASKFLVFVVFFFNLKLAKNKKLCLLCVHACYWTVTKLSALVIFLFLKGREERLLTAISKNYSNTINTVPSKIDYLQFYIYIYSIYSLQ